jgi:hypothetical protein
MAQEKISKVSSLLGAKDVPFFYFLYFSENKKVFPDKGFLGRVE